MGYESWSEWCDCELDGFKLPAVERRELVAALAEGDDEHPGISNRSIAEIVRTSDMTVGRDLEAGATNVAPGKVVGADGKTYPKPRKPREPFTRDQVAQADYLNAINLLRQALRPCELKTLDPPARILLIKFLKETLEDLGPFTVEGVEVVGASLPG